MTLRIRSNQTLLFVGDSITDCGRRDINAPLGDGYVKLFNDIVVVREPSRNINVINKGIGGNTIKDLQNRWDDDVLRHKPDWLAIHIGINDLHGCLNPMPDSITPGKFSDCYNDMLTRTKKKLPSCKILLIEPFYVSVSKSKGSVRAQVLELIQQYISVVRTMNIRYRTSLVKTHDLFTRLLKYHESEMFSPDAVHPNQTGHLVIAEAVYTELSR